MGTWTGLRLRYPACAMSSARSRWRLAVAAGFAMSLLTPATALGLSTRSATTTTAVGDSILVATAKCHPDEHVISGGFRGPSGNVVLTSRRAGPRGWKVVTAFNSDEKLTAYAYCSKRSALTEHPSAIKTLAASDSFVTTAKSNFARGEFVYSGG